MEPGRINKWIAVVCLAAGLPLLFFWRDMGLTLLLIGAANFIFYRRESDWVVV